jgi:HEAT repeat protein
MFTRRRITILLLAAVLLLSAVFVVLRPAPEPSYQGKTLSAWLTTGNIGHPIPEAITMVIRNIGTNGIPFLLEWIQYEPSAWKIKLNKLSAVILDRQLFENQLASARKRAIRAGLAFEILGPEANTAIPDLIRIMNTSTKGFTNLRAARALGWIGKEAIPPLIGILKSGQPKAQCNSFSALARMGTNAIPVLPVMIQCLGGGDEKVVASAIWALGELHLQPDLVVPALTNFLMNSQPALQVCAANALSRFGPEAQIAEPLLQRLLSSSESKVRVSATNALLKIAPEALTNVPTR